MQLNRLCRSLMIRADRNFAGGEPSLELKGADTVMKRLKYQSLDAAVRGRGEPTTFLGYGPTLGLADGRQKLGPFRFVPSRVRADTDQKHRIHAGHAYS